MKNPEAKRYKVCFRLIKSKHKGVDVVEMSNILAKSKRQAKTISKRLYDNNPIHGAYDHYWAEIDHGAL